MRRPTGVDEGLGAWDQVYISDKKRPFRPTEAGASPSRLQPDASRSPAANSPLKVWQLRPHTLSWTCLPSASSHAAPRVREPAKTDKQTSNTGKNDATDQAGALRS
ncbi:hypothetical protein PtrSN002B_002560 [Pyrenophora tritici-repentis]|nr:hypothetical protein PtrV1_10439 [Pyrenophora tritici-repentis]KAF7567532.1 hypothetical protein PtrM4_141230 [Pyrenophora tritici-repentis]KAI0582787.1 hypothetical protein Alg215_03910 [Pyrenophora tritici-repentis]KAI0588495.1 hypothetical protein Alg130_03347 [Pyrenophora tritici-repentis]KAI0612343.1 hypothetical protein TUN205_03386 [Pyrenophora tritici-repentis]